MREAWRVYLVSSLLSCVVAAGTALVTVRLLDRATAQSPANSAPGSPGVPSSPNTVIWEDIVEMRIGGEHEVFYKAPFASPPHLIFPDGLATMQCEVTDQKAGSFKLRRAGVVPYGAPDPAKVKWKAEGQPAK
jgi:hypothetical protein